MWITNGGKPAWMCCLVSTSEGKPHIDKSLVIVPMDLPGVQRSRKAHKLGMWSSDTAEIFFDDVRIPQRYRIGAEGMGFMMQMQQFQRNASGGAQCHWGMRSLFRHHRLCQPAHGFWAVYSR